MGFASHQRLDDPSVVVGKLTENSFGFVSAWKALVTEAELFGNPPLANESLLFVNVFARGLNKRQ